MSLVEIIIKNNTFNKVIITTHIEIYTKIHKQTYTRTNKET